MTWGVILTELTTANQFPHNFRCRLGYNPGTISDDAREVEKIVQTNRTEL